MKKVFMYTLSTCPWCRKTKKFFSEHSIPFDFVDYDLAGEDEQERLDREMSELSSDANFPLVKINGDVVVGYDPEKYEELLGLKAGVRK
ncbi:NrdH-redoxin [Methanocella sp. CWC-04]|uniref:NrdH-redoxin n=2 Tax=Methanooceanicella nereidis TaxID=2052831 RepID=A0AAP2R9T7_9EURY|nr:NrdH-redoxin [Methanocella sp. CWC-04]